ncbi:cobalt/zinc/cadmium resistance heavy metal efflux pump protein CzcA [Neokomagataea thailandica NBRC 106555]|uniref:Efflux RND transporter permease subunit n=2 Tax=Neokomagataea TaxID=1223423 RepID=A0A4Y6VC22_9PROT|nr:MULTISPECIES: CusA/CzcA family heavy metal efflux RND transporter [Neokomagataea]QDH26046.1 efflux RND transporter permease subunit [Neokomagataea tanensis]GBR52350.1 cobalt/zinc/cadmium resistance heavy metal efflux pump protein CzcA [Neokomagataea thailandica NBRC 106555]
MNVLEFMLKNRGVMLGLIIALMLGGLATIPGLPVEPAPDISPRQVMVSVTAPGLATEEVEKLITLPVETALTGIPGTTDLRSVSRTGVSAIYLQFADDTDIDLDRTRVSERLDIARGNITVPNATLMLGPRATGMGEIMQIQLKGPGFSPMTLNRLMTWTVAPMLKLVPGVADVNVNGGAEETFQIALQPARLRALDISIAQVDRAIEENNAASGGGWIAQGATAQVIVGRSLVQGLDAFGAIPVKFGDRGNAIRLRDLGIISEAARMRLGAVTRDGQGEIVNGVVMMQIGASSNATITGIRAALPAIRQALPTGISLDPFYSRTTLTDQTITTIKENLVIGAALVLLVLVVVLGDWRASLAIASVIPVALIAAMAGMRLFGVSANLLSLGAIDFGMIVDSALVIVEHLMAERGNRPNSAALPRLAIHTTRLVARPVIFAIAVIIMVYLPILTLQGIEGKMFKPMAQTVIMALLASLIYGFVGVPLIASLLLRRSPPDRETRLIASMRRHYERALDWSRTRAELLIGIVAVVVATAALMGSRLGGEFVPQLKEGSLVVTSVRLPSASLATVLADVTREERIVRGFPEVATIVSNTGTAAIPTDPMGPYETDSFVLLKPSSTWPTGMTQEALVADLSATLQRELPDAEYSFSQPIQMRMDDLLSGVRTQLAVFIYGEDLDRLGALAAKTATVLRSVSGAADVQVQGDGTVPFLRIDVNRDAAARLGVAVPDILAMVEAIGGRAGKPVIVDNAIVGTQVRLDPSFVTNVDRIGDLQIRRADGKGWVLLSEVARIATLDGPPRIDRDGLQRRIIIQANVRGRDTSSFVTDAQKAVARAVFLPHGYHIVWAGQFRNLQSAMARLNIVVPIALGLIYGLLVVALESQGAAALVFVNLPVAATGGIFMLVFRGFPFSIAAGIGFIALFGVAILNGVVLLSQIGLYRKAGMTPGDAAFAAARSRFRPVIATASVAMLGFFPMAFSAGAGAEVERPLASVVIGGLVSSTALTLLLLPAFYARLFGGRQS